MDFFLSLRLKPKSATERNKSRPSLVSAFPCKQLYMLFAIEGTIGIQQKTLSTTLEIICIHSHFHNWTEWLHVSFPILQTFCCNGSSHCEGGTVSGTVRTQHSSLWATATRRCGIYTTKNKSKGKKGQSWKGRGSCKQFQFVILIL